MHNIFANTTSQGLGGMLRGVEALPGNLLQRELGLSRDGTLKQRSFVDKLRPGRSLTTSALRNAIAKNVRELAKRVPAEDRLPSDAVKDIVENVMGHFRRRGGPVTLDDLRGVHSHLREIFEPNQIDVALPDDLNDRDEIEDRFNKMFGDDGIVAFKRIATAALSGVWDVDISKPSGDRDHEGMIKVAFTDKNNPQGQFEFFLEKVVWKDVLENEHVDWRILCGDDFARRAALGDSHLKQVTELLTELVRYSKKHALDNDAVKAAVFKVPSGSNIHSLLRNGYGTLTKWATCKLIVGMAYRFVEHEKAFVQAMGAKKYEKAKEAINAIVMEAWPTNMERVAFLSDAQTLDELGYDSQSHLAGRVNKGEKEIDRSHVMKIADYKGTVNLGVLKHELESDPKLSNVVEGMIDEQGGRRVPLGRVLSTMAISKEEFFVVAYELSSELQGLDAGQRRGRARRGRDVQPGDRRQEPGHPGVPAPGDEPSLTAAGRRQRPAGDHGVAAMPVTTNNAAIAPAADTPPNPSRTLGGEAPEALSGKRPLSASRSGLAGNVTNKTVFEAIAANRDRDGLTPEQLDTMVENAMRYLEGPGPVTPVSLGVLNSKPGRIEK